MKGAFSGSLALLTDLYQLTMIYGYWKADLAEREAVFHLHFRTAPFGGGFALAAGLQTVMDFIHDLHFSQSDLAFLEKQGLFEKGFLDFLSKFSFSCDLWAVKEGTVIFAQEPLIRVQGPLWQAQLLESALLNLINFQTLIATKAARICFASTPDPVLEFGLRRAQGVDGALSASRAAFIGGCVATSHVLAGKTFGIPIQGTHAHSWVMAFDEEKTAFATFAKIRKDAGSFLIDTYDTYRGAKRAIEVARSILGFHLAAVRIDSGDLAELSIQIRELLDREGFVDTKILASNELDEFLIEELKGKGARIDVWGVGTRLVTGGGQASLDGVYKLSALRNAKGQWVHKLKLSEQEKKTTHPGILQVRRFSEGGHHRADVIYDELLAISYPLSFLRMDSPYEEITVEGAYRDLLIEIFQGGKRVYESPSLEEIQKYAKEELRGLLPSFRKLKPSSFYPVGFEKSLAKKKRDLIDQIKRTGKSTES